MSARDEFPIPLLGYISMLVSVAGSYKIWTGLGTVCIAGIVDSSYTTNWQGWTCMQAVIDLIASYRLYLGIDNIYLRTRDMKRFFFAPTVRTLLEINSTPQSFL